jgi:hypothetical protein
MKRNGGFCLLGYKAMWSAGSQFCLVPAPVYCMLPRPICWRSHVSKRQMTMNVLHGVPSQKTDFSMANAMIASYLPYIGINDWTNSMELSTARETTICEANRTFPSILWNLKPDQYLKKKLPGLSPRANYTDRATAVCQRSDCQLLRIEGATWSACRIPTAVYSVF